MTTQDTLYTVQIQKDIVTVAVSDNGEYHIKTDNIELKRLLKSFLKHKEKLPLVKTFPQITFEADVTDPVGLTAALLSLSSQSVLVTAPPIVFETIRQIKP